MTVDTFLGYLDELPAVRAERLLDAAGAANPSKEWLEALRPALRPTDADETDGTVLAPMLYRFNGVPVSVTELRGHLADALGAGFGDS